MREASPRARKRPGMVLVAYLARAILGAFLAFPIAARAASWTSGRKEGAGIFFEPGGLYLLEALRLGRDALADEFQRLAFATLLAGYFGLLPLAALLFALSRKGPLRLGDLARASIRHLGTFSLLLALALGAYAFVASLALAAVSSLGQALSSPWPALAVLVVALLAMAAMGIVHDLARAQVVLHEALALPALRAALASFGWRALTAWAARCPASLALLASAAFLVGQLGIASPRALVATFLVHQLALFGLVSLRASFLAAALRIAGSRGSA